MGDETEVFLIQIESAGGDEASDDLKKVSDATDKIKDSNIELSSQLGKGLNTGGMHLLTHEMMQSVGMGGQMRVVFPLVAMATREADEAMFAFGGTLAEVTLGASLLAAGILYLIETHKKHKETIENVNSELDKQKTSMQNFLDSQDMNKNAQVNTNAELEKQIDLVQKNIEEEKKWLEAHNEDTTAMGGRSAVYEETMKALENNYRALGDLEDQAKKNIKTTEDLTKAKGDEIKTLKDEGNIWDKLALDSDRSMNKVIEADKKQYAEFKETYGGMVSFGAESMKLIGKAVVDTANGNVDAWKKAGEQMLVNLLDMLEKQLEAWSIASFAHHQFVEGAAELAAIGAVEGIKAEVGGAGTMSSSTGSTPIATSSVGSSASTGVSSTATTGVSSANVTINAGMMFMPDQASFMSALQQFWLQSGIAMNSGIIPKYQLA